MPSFNDFHLQPTTRAVLASMEITEPTPIQAEAIPVLLAGNDLVGQSATGSGKTLAYGIPLVERLSREKRAVQALVLVPTRELAVQVNTVLSRLAISRRLSTALLVGGRPYGTQISSLRYGAQIVVGTPGRVQDHIERGTLVLSQLRMCVLDEADQMLDIGFAPIIEEILATTPDTRQMALFSATMPEWIAKLQEKFLKDPVKVDITAATGGQSTIEQIAYQVPQSQKMAALCTLLHSAQGESSLIFGKTKFGVEKLGVHLTRLGFTVGTLHGNKSQRARDEVLTAFRRGHVQTLLATNVAARGLDIKGIYQVINYELPESSDLFTHRIGRTGRMGQQGKAITLLEPSDLSKWRRMARNLGQEVVLLRLAIDKETIVAVPLARPEASAMQEYEQRDEPRPVRGRKQFSSNQERGRFIRPEASVAQEYERGDEPRPARGRKQSLDQVREKFAWPETSIMEDEQENEPRPARGRKQFSSDQERERPTRPEVPIAQEYERSNEPRPARGRKQFSSDQERERPARPEAPIVQEYERSNEPRPARGRKQFSSDQEHERPARPKRDSHTESGVKSRQNDRVTAATSVRTPAWQPEGFTPSIRPTSGEAQDSRRTEGKPANSTRTVGKHKAHSFAATEPQRTARRKPRANPAARAQRAANRAASR